MLFNICFIFSFMIPTYYVILDVIFALFLAQNFKTKVLAVQKNLLLECLHQSLSAAPPGPAIQLLLVT